ncbi:hypothetical protein HYE67_006251 [Fusarium culmorum]|uniref:Uncharacterized protein n=1 Tax=Fusarium culmorum TaxID=5516 RepID=A0A2T4GCH6_FUSCU|nr:hypothetical protein FCULG_00009954 [Fusarium culmorum]QPC64020.1 hypothetical protein HYE67_006251 [Fusarium culmorum]
MLAFSTEYLHVPTTKYPLGKRHDNACEKCGESLPAAHLVPSGPVTHSIRLFYEVKGRVYPPRTTDGFHLHFDKQLAFLARWVCIFRVTGAVDQVQVICPVLSNPHLQVMIKQATNLPTLIDI